MVIKAQETDGMIAKDGLSCSRSCKLTGYEIVFEALKDAFSLIIRVEMCGLEKSLQIFISLRSQMKG